MRAGIGIVALAMLAGCQQPAELTANAAWVRLPAVSGQPGAAYFTLNGGSKGDILLAVSSPAALRAEIHESMKNEHGMMTMSALKAVEVPAATTVTFAPGGKHVMLFSVGPAVKPGSKVPLMLAFAGGKQIELQATAVGAGDSPPTE